MSQAQGQTPARGTVASLDILRLIAALLVVVYHYFFLAWSEAPGGGGIRDVIPNGPTYPWAVPAISAGWVGVEVFFVISGFVITMSAQGKTAGDFLKGRFLRLFPGILIFATCAYAVIVSAGVLPVGLATERYLRTLVLFPKGPWIDGVIWTLVAEAQDGTNIARSEGEEAMHSARLARNEDGTAVIFVGKRVSPLNWLEITGDGPFSLALTLYDTAAFGGVGSGADTLPAIDREDCA